MLAPDLFRGMRRVLALVITLLILALMLGVYRTAHAQDSVAAPVTTSSWGKYVAAGPVPKGMLAVTVCVAGSPVIHFAKDDGFATEQEVNDVIVHEMTHVRQLSSDTTITCEQAFSRITADADALTRAEAEATCAQATWTAGNGGDGIGLIERWVEKFTAYLNSTVDLGWHRSPTNALRIISANCPLMSSLYQSQ